MCLKTELKKILGFLHPISLSRCFHPSMAALLKASSSYCTNQSTNRRFIVTPPPATRISFPINRRLFTPLTQTPLPKITTATTKCSNNSSSGGSTFRKEKEEEPFPLQILQEALMKAMLKPALTAILVWVLLTNNPIIAYSYSSRTAFFWGVWFVYDVCKAIASRRRIGDDDDGSIQFSLGNVLGSTVLLFSGLMSLLMGVLVVVLIAVFIGIVLFICGSAAVILLLTMVFLGMVFGFGKVTLHALVTEDESVNTTDEQKKKKKSANVQV